MFECYSWKKFLEFSKEKISIKELPKFVFFFLTDLFLGNGGSLFIQTSVSELRVNLRFYAVFKEKLRTNVYQNSSFMYPGAVNDWIIEHKVWRT